MFNPINSIPSSKNTSTVSISKIRKRSADEVSTQVPTQPQTPTHTNKKRQIEKNQHNLQTMEKELQKLAQTFSQEIVKLFADQFKRAHASAQMHTSTQVHTSTHNRPVTDDSDTDNSDTDDSDTDNSDTDNPDTDDSDTDISNFDVSHRTKKPEGSCNFTNCRHKGTEPSGRCIKHKDRPVSLNKIKHRVNSNNMINKCQHGNCGKWTIYKGNFRSKYCSHHDELH